MILKNGYVLSVVFAILTLIVVLFAGQTSQYTTGSKVHAQSAFSAIAVMGDSNADEYRADDNRGGAYAATTFGWVEELVNHRNLNFGRYAYWGGFRRTGYEYNFSRTAATTGSGLQSDAPSALSSLVSSGTIPFVYYALGANDFAWYNSQFGDIYSGQLSGSSLDSFIQQTVNNITTSLDTINSSHKAKILVSLVPNGALSPTAQSRYPDPVKLQRVTDAVAKTNTQLRSALSQRGYAVFDPNAVYQRLVQKMDSERNLIIGGEKISFTTNGDEPHHVLLADGIHSGTIVSGLYANEVVSAMNTSFGTNIQPFSDDELLVHAGIKAATSSPAATPTPIVTSSPVVTPTIVATASPTPTVTPITPSPTVRPTASPTPTIRATATPTTRPSVTPITTPTPTSTPVDTYAKYCGTYTSWRSFLVRFLSSSQIATWDARCHI